VTLDQTYQAFLAQNYPHGEAVARKMFQLLDYALTWEEPAADNVIGRIISSEETLLGRSPSELIRDGSALKPLRHAMGAASDKEWQAFLQEKQIPQLSREDRLSVYQYQSGILGKDFTDWVLTRSDEGKNPDKEKGH